MFHHLGFPDGSLVKNLPANAGDVGSVPGLGRSPGEGRGNPLQSPCLENYTDREGWGAAVCGAAEADTAERLKDNSHGAAARCSDTARTACRVQGNVAAADAD